MTRFESVGSQQVPAVLFLDQLATCVRDGPWKNEICKVSTRLDLGVQVGGLTISTSQHRLRMRTCTVLLEVPRKPIREDVVLLRALFRHERLERLAEEALISPCACANEVQ